jgi:multiple sugar transport system substrate-binding protein
MPAGGGVAREAGMRGTSGWRRVAALMMAVAVMSGMSGMAGCGSSAPGRVVLNFNADGQGISQYQLAAAECGRASGGRYTIESHNRPAHSTDEERLQVSRRLAAHDSSLDIMTLDVVWTAEFARAGWILPYPPALARKIGQGTLRGPLETGTYRGRLYAAPLSTNVQLLWYRKDLVPHPPKTWDEMIQMAQRLAARGLPHYIEAQGRRYEGLTAWFNTLLASGGGSIVSEDGTVRVAQGTAARQALNVMARLATSLAADPSLSLSTEDDARLAVQAGTAAFEVNYPFDYASMQESGGGTFIDSQGRPTTRDTGRRVGDVFGWAAYPSVTTGTPARVTLGGINLGVSASSRHPAQAFEAVQCLRNWNHQLLNAVKVERPPTLVALYDAPALRRHYPAWREIRDALDTASVRPATPAYASVSLAISDLLNPPAKIKPGIMVGQLADRITKAVASQGLVP